MNSGDGVPNEIQALILAWLFCWGWVGVGYLIYLGADGAPSAYQAWVCCAWTLVCTLVPLGIVAGLGLATKDDCTIKPNGGAVILAALGAALGLVGVIAGLLLTPLAHHVAPKLVVSLSAVVFAASVAMMIYASKGDPTHE